MNTAPLWPAWSVPPIVRQTCPFCRGSGLREMPAKHRALTRLDRCAPCCGRGFVVTEHIDLEAK